MIEKTFKMKFPGNTQPVQPGIEKNMEPLPIYEHEEYDVRGNRLKDKVTVISGGDSGIGRAVSVAYAKEGSDIAIIYYNEDIDANETKSIIEKEGRRCILIKGDIGDENFIKSAINTVIKEFNKIDIVIPNAAEQHYAKGIEDITLDQLSLTFKTNVFGSFMLIKECIPYLKEGASIIITTSITAYEGNETLIDYSSTKGALVALTKSLAKNLAPKLIRVNAVAPGPVWTPLIPASFPKSTVEQFGANGPLKRAAQPVELAESYVFLASQGASYITGETIHVNGGQYVS